MKGQPMPNLVFEVDGSGTVIYSNYSAASGPGTGQVRVHISGGVEPHTAAAALDRALENYQAAHSGQWGIARNAHLTVT